MNTLLYDFWGKRSYSQAGEDMIVWAELGLRSGFYVDVGAYHPKQFSNTYYLYKKGWRGIVVEPNADMCRAFQKSRRRDVVLNVGVGEKEGQETYFMFTDPAVNTFDRETAKKNLAVGREMVGKKKVVVMSLKSILGKHLSREQKIDLLSIDAEGMDEQVLSSNDWEKYRPRVVITEDLDFDWRNVKKSAVSKMMIELGYRLVGMTPYSLIFKDDLTKN